jgi:quercetin dioxygenase-like cupin family protein
MHVSAVTGATQLCIFEQWVAPGAGAPTHRHLVEEVLTVIGGEADVWIEEKHIILTCGSSLIVPASRKRGFRNIGSETLHIQAILASAIFEASFDTGAVQCWLVPN